MNRSDLRLHVNGLVRSVQVARCGARVEVVLDGTRHVVDAAQIEPGRWSLLFDDQQSHEVLVRTGQPGELTVHVDGVVVPVRLLDPRSGRSGGTDAVGTSGLVRLTAPMPGRVVRLLAAPGDVVGARQGLVVVEAMKMENELRAPRAGTVVELLVHEGSTVEAGTLLLTLS